MASGDRQRTWFPEMVDLLRVEWRPEMSWEDLIALRDRVDGMMTEIRRSPALEVIKVRARQADPSERHELPGDLAAPNDV